MRILGCPCPRQALPNQYDFHTLTEPQGTVQLDLERERSGETGV